MKHIKQSFIKRGFAFLLCTILFSSTVFMSYGNTLTVEASDLGYDDLLRDATNIALATLGVYVVAQSGGSLAPAMVPYISAIAGAGFDVHDYVTDNGDGTTTISEDFVQLVLQSYNQYKEDNAEMFDGTMTPGADGYYHFDGLTLSLNCTNASFLEYNRSVTYTDISTTYPFAILVYSKRQLEPNSNNYSACAYAVFYIESDDRFYSFLSVTSVPYDEMEDYTDFGQASQDMFYVDKPHYVMRYISTGKAETGNSYISSPSMYGYAGQYTTVQASSSDIPVYYDLASLKEGLRTGDFSAAYNYGKLPDCETSKYTGSYSGGDITVTNEKLDGVLGKLDEINETDKSIDDKLKDLLDWLGIGDGSGGTGGGIAPSHWYDAVLDYLDKILKQLKSIKRWTIIDTFIDGVDAIADWLDLIHDILSDVDDGMESAVATLSSALNDATGLLKTKFPFSVPWDIFFFVTLLAAEPEVPHFELPIDFDVSALDMHVHYDFVLDFTDYQYLSDIARVILSMTYAVGLLKMTSGIVSTKKEE